MPQENFPTNDTTGSPESKERRIKTIEIKVGEQTYQLEAESYDFEYPKNIQEETGILGYERTKINKDQLIATLGFKEKNLFNSEILNSLSEGNYPKNTYNHELGGYAGSKALKMHEDLKNDKFFVQKIYDIDRIKKLRSNTNALEIFNHNVAGRDHKPDYSIPRSNITILNKETLKLISGKKHPVGKIPEYEDKINSGEVFGASAYGGLNVMPSFFFEGIDLERFSVGFPKRLEGFHKEYFLKSLQIYVEIFNEIENQENGELKGDFLKNIARIVYMFFIDEIYSNESIRDEIDTMRLLPDDLNVFGENPNKQRLFDIYEDFISNFCSKNEINLDFFPQGFDEFTLKGEIFYNLALPVEELFIPIFIGHDEIPQLSWGHAKYAHYMNEKGLNFFKFKHAAHLPYTSEKSETEIST